MIKPEYIRVASDLHLEQLLGQREEFLAEVFVPHDERDAKSILVLAGDISSKPAQLLKFLQWLNGRFLHVIYVPGNHEYYGHEMEKWNTDILQELDKDEMHFVSCAGSGVGLDEFDGLRVIHTTLWADGGKTAADRDNVERYLTDFRVIKIGDKKFKVPDMQALHKTQKRMLVELLKAPFDGKTLVVTHHMPSHRLCHPRFGTDCNGGFASNCEDILAYDHAPEVWVHGHTHDTGDSKMWNTRVVCNPSGYHYEHGSMFTKYGPKFLTVATMEELEPVIPAHVKSV